MALALARAARTWIDFENGKPQTSALDAAPHLADDFVENLTRPGIGLEWLTPHVPDRIRWKCVSCAWVWDAVVSSRAGQETGCPKCASKRLGHERSRAQPEQSLATLHPDLAQEFVGCIPHPERTASQLKPSSNFLCAWLCRTCAHNWKASPGTRLRGRGCPVCARERARLSRTIAPADESLLALDPDLAREFVACLDEPDRSPVDLLPKSNKACQWRCATCGHQWLAKVATRAAGNGCPQCGRARTAQARASAPPGGSLLDLFPQLALEAVENLDRPERDPHALRPGSHNRCQWRCATCSHSWVTSVKNRAIHGTRCPACVRAQLRSTDEGKP
ncbi:zinc-ribbon domain-containing protein [Streptomyces sp. NPDC048357]|uniref:zinc-ribbon domain-containing protein n=1 Tax=Streptomyces sp. NPDC048357 TaxID=3154719 RepID=UPI0034332489